MGKRKAKSVKKRVDSSQHSSRVKMEELSLSSPPVNKRPRTSEDFLRFCDVVLSYANYPSEFLPNPLSSSYNFQNNNHLQIHHSNINNNTTTNVKKEPEEPIIMEDEEEEPNVQHQLHQVVKREEEEEEEEPNVKHQLHQVVKREEEEEEEEPSVSLLRMVKGVAAEGRRKERRTSGLVDPHSHSNNNISNHRRKLESPLNSVGESVRGSTRSSTSSTCTQSDSSLDVDIETPEYDESWSMVTCWCGKPFAGRPMIECEGCLVWLHLSCARVRKAKIPKSFKCNRCKPSGRRKKSAPSSSISSINPGGDKANGTLEPPNAPNLAVTTQPISLTTLSSNDTNMISSSTTTTNCTSSNGLSGGGGPPSTSSSFSTVSATNTKKSTKKKRVSTNTKSSRKYKIKPQRRTKKGKANNKSASNNKNKEAHSSSNFEPAATLTLTSSSSASFAPSSTHQHQYQHNNLSSSSGVH